MTINPCAKLVKLDEAGYKPAIYGLQLSKRVPDRQSDMAQLYAEFVPNHALAQRLAGRGNGHDKFLQAIMTWWSGTFSLSFWKHFDQYRHSLRLEEPTQSESTMVTILKRPLAQDDFLYPVPDATISRLNFLIAERDFAAAINELPGGFLQTRQITLNYAALRNILIQRSRHKLGEWSVFCAGVLAQVDHAELLTMEKP